MEAWGPGSFENFDAPMWAGLLGDVEGLGYVESTLDLTLRLGEYYLDSLVAREAIAACETLARLLGAWGKQDIYTEDMDRWVRSHRLRPSAELLDKARLALRRIVAEDSELKEYWEGTPELEAWLQSIANLTERLSPSD